MEYKYDVFISYSRKDYVVDDMVIPHNPISEIMDLFDKNNVSYWIDKEGISSGQQFVEVITDAIVNSMMLVFVSSSNSNSSKWTANEIFEAYDDGKLIIPVKIDNSDYNKKYRMIIRPFDFIDYNNQPNTALPSLLKAVKNEIVKIERKEKELQLEKEKKRIITNLSLKIKELQGLMGQQVILLKELYADSKYLGSKTKVCPICKSVSSVETPFCISCGWKFSPLYGIYGVDSHSLHDEIQLKLVHDLWEKAILSDEYKTCLDLSKKKIADLAKHNDELELKLYEIGKAEEAERQRQKTLENKVLKPIEKDGKYGFQDETGKTVLPFKWSYVDSFQEGFARVKDENNKWGFIDKTGKVVIPCQWNGVGIFNEEFAYVIGDNWKYGYIDKTGKVVIPCQWKDAGHFVNGLARVGDEKGNWFYIDATGKVIRKA